MNDTTKEYIDKNGTEHCDTSQELNEYIEMKNKELKFDENDNKDACW